MNLILNDLTLHIGDKLICNDFSEQFKPGDFCGILGKNGAGKSSFLLALAGLRALTKGHIFYGENDLLQLPGKTRAKVLSLLLQEHSYPFPNSVFETIMSGRHPHCSRLLGESSKDIAIVRKLLDEFSLTDLQHRSILALSGGERQRVAIAALLAQQTEILLLDEPCNHLDIEHKIELLNKLKTLAQKENKIILMVLHDINLVAQYCNKVLLFHEHGEIVSGLASELLTAANLSQLYHYPIQHLQVDNKDIFVA